MINIKVTKYDIEPRQIYCGTQGSEGMETLSFGFSSEWDGLIKSVTFYPARSRPQKYYITEGEPFELPPAVSALGGKIPFTLEGSDGDTVIITLSGTAQISSTLQAEAADMIEEPYSFTREMAGVVKAAAEDGAKQAGDKLEADATKGRFNGKDGGTVYVAYSHSADGSNFTPVREEGMRYIGFAMSAGSRPSSASDYQWSEFVGKDGKDGSTVYVAYSHSADGSNFTPVREEGMRYIGFAMSADGRPSSASDYQWTEFVGKDGKDGSGTVRTELMIDTPVWQVQPATEKTQNTITMNKFLRDWDNSQDGGGPGELIVYPGAGAGSPTYWMGGVELSTASLMEYQPISSITDGILTTVSGGVYNYTGTAEFVDASAAPTDVNLKSLFKDYTVKNYFVTLKGTDGTALPSGQFKLTEALNGHATAIDCVFTLEGHKLTENYPVDFKEVDGVFKMRDAGVTKVTLNCENPTARIYRIRTNGHQISTKTSGSFLFRFNNNMVKKENVTTIGVSAYAGANGVIVLANNNMAGGKKMLSAILEYEVIRNGATGTFDIVNEPGGSGQRSFMVLARNKDLTGYKYEEFTMYFDSSVFANGTVIVLEETA